MLDISRPPPDLSPIRTALREEVGRMCIWKRFQAWRFTNRN